MKKLSIFFIFLLFATLAQAQIALAKSDGTPIVNGQIITYNTTVESNATLYYKIINTTNSPIDVKIKIENLVNTTGSGFQFCYLNVCKFSVALGAIYPDASSPTPTINIAANSSTVGAGYNMWNGNAGNGTFPLDVVLKFFAVDSFGQEYGTPVTMTYRYDPNAALGVKDLEKTKNSFAQIENTIVEDVLHISVKENTKYSIYAADGKRISQGILAKGKQSIDLSEIGLGTYFVQLQNDLGEVIHEKIRK